MDTVDRPVKYNQYERNLVQTVQRSQVDNHLTQKQSALISLGFISMSLTFKASMSIAEFVCLSVTYAFDIVYQFQLRRM